MTSLKQTTVLFLTALLLLILTGCSTTSNTTSSTISNTVPNNTSELLSLSTERYGHATVNDGTHLFVIAGANKTGFLSDIEIIDPISGKKEIIKGQLIPRHYFSAVWDGKHSIYIIGGVSLEDDIFRFERKVEIFDTITHQVTFAESLPSPTRINTVVYLDEKIYVMGGTYPNKRKKKMRPTSLVYVLNIAKNRWHKAKRMPTARTTKAALHNGFIYTVGGYDTKSSLDAFERFDPQLNMWESLPAIPAKISAHSLTVVKDKLFVFGNYNDMAATYSYSFLTQKWKKIEIGYKPSRHNATTTLGDTTYVTGGNTGTKGPFLDYIQTFKLNQ